MIKGLVSIVLGLFFLNVNAQNEFDYYKVYELNITDLNTLTTNENFDFGYNYSVDSSKLIELGYYLWIENTWYKIINDNEIFKVEDKSPLYFKIDRTNKKDLRIKDSVGSVYFYKVELLESYLVSELIYKTNLDVIKNIAEAEFVSDRVLSDSKKVDGEKIASVEVETKSKKDEIALIENVSINEINIANAEAMLFPIDGVLKDEIVVKEVDLVLEENSAAQDVVSHVDNNYKNIQAGEQSEKSKMMTGFFIAPNVDLSLSARKGRVLYFDLFEYYEKYFSNAFASSSIVPTKIQLSKTDFEYQVTSYNKDEIEILEITDSGILKYKILKSDFTKPSSINVRFVLF